MKLARVRSVKSIRVMELDLAKNIQFDDHINSFDHHLSILIRCRASWCCVWLVRVFTFIMVRVEGFNVGRHMW